jgi:predicted alpha/beta hydrolase family esterase
MRRQILYIGWGEALENLSFKKFREERFSRMWEYMDFNPFAEKRNNWKSNLERDLWENIELIKMFTPNSSSAVYTEWKMAFEKTMSFLWKKVSVIWYSLWSIFILKYLWECDKTGSVYKKIEKLYTLGTPYEDGSDELLGSFSANMDIMAKALEWFQKNMYFYASRDDEVVNFWDFLKYIALFPDSNFREFVDYWHFFDVERVDELLFDISNT